MWLIGWTKRWYNLSVRQSKFDFLNDRLIKVAKKYDFAYVGVFGSAARGEMEKDSDIDLLVRFDGDTQVSLFDLVRIENELAKELGREVDLVTKLNKYVEPYAKRDLVTIYEKR